MDTKFKQTEIGEIPENWQVVKIGDVAKSISETYKFNDQPVVFLNTGDIYDGKILNNNLIKSKGLPGQAKKSIKVEDILFSEIRPANKRFAFVDFEVKNYVVSTKLMVIRALEIINPKYLYIVLTNPNLLNRFQILAESRSGTFPQITFDSIKNIEIPLPSKMEQESIVDSFFSVSNKIELNQKSIKTLEEIGQTLFKRWFIDFEFPNEKGDPYKSNGGEMVDSELGEIPKRWIVQKSKEMIELIYGKALKGENRIDGLFPVYGSSGIVGYHNEGLVKGPGIVLGRKGNVGSVFWSNNDFCAIDTVYYIKSTLDQYYVYYELKNHQFVNGDSVVPGLSRSQFYLEKWIVPDLSILDKFHEIIETNFKLIENNKIEIEKLTILKDSLLPKLLSGKIKV